MTDLDDRAAFEEKKRVQALALGRDRRTFEAAVDALHAADRYDYPYLWSWMGVPIIQLPADIIATQEIIWATKPDLIVETGVARGGSVLFMASILELIGKGKVVGIDIDIRAHNRDSIERHAMAKRVVLIEGDSTDSNTLAKVKAEIPVGGSVMVVLDSDHSREHVLAELRSYGPLVTMGCYLVVADTILGHLDANQTPRNRSQLYLKGNEPLSALECYLKETNRFETDPVVNGKLILSSSPGGYLRCVGGAASTIGSTQADANKRYPDLGSAALTRGQRLAMNLALQGLRPSFFPARPSSSASPGGHDPVVSLCTGMCTQS